MDRNNADVIIDPEKISILEDALNDHTSHLVRFRNVSKRYKKNETVNVFYEVHPSYCPTSSDWIGLFPEDWVSPFHYVTFEWADVNLNVGLKETKFHLEEVTLPEDSKFQFLYISNDESVIAASPAFALFEKNDDCRNLKDNINEPFTDVCGSSRSLAAESDSEGSFELLEAEHFEESSETESSSGIQSMISEIFADRPTPAPVEKSSDHITLTQSFTPSGESIYNWLRYLEEKENEDIEKTTIGQSSVEKEIGSFNTACRKIEEINENNNPKQNLDVPYPITCLENQKTLHCSQLQLNTLSSQLCQDPGQISSTQIESLVCKAQAQLNSSSSIPEVTAAVLPGVSGTTCQCEKEKKGLAQEKSRLQKRLKNVSDDKKRLNAELKEVQEVSEFHKLLLVELTGLLRTAQNERDSLQTANNMLSQRICLLEKTAALTKKDQQRLASSASMTPKLMSEISSLRNQLTALVLKVKGTNSDRLSQLERENEKLLRDLADLKKQHSELQDQYEDILHSLFDGGITGLVRKNDNGNMTLIATGKNTSSFNVISDGVQMGSGQMLELQNWRNVKDKRSAKHLRMVARQQDRTESLSSEITQLQEKLRSEGKMSLEWKKDLKAIKNENKDLREKLTEQEGINSFLCETINVQSNGVMAQPLDITKLCKSSSDNCEAASTQNCRNIFAKSAYKSANCDASINTTKIPLIKPKLLLDAATNTPQIKTESMGTNTSSTDPKERKSSKRPSRYETKTTNTTSYTISKSSRPPCKVKFTHEMPTVTTTPGPCFQVPECITHSVDVQLNNPLQLVPYKNNKAENLDDEEESIFPMVCCAPTSTKRTKKYDLELHPEEWENQDCKYCTNFNSSANPEFSNSPLPSNATEDILNWGIDAMASFADKCEAEIKSFYSYFEHVLKAENDKRRAKNETTFDDIDERTQRMQQTDPLPDSVIYQIDGDEVWETANEYQQDPTNDSYSDYDFD